MSGGIKVCQLPIYWVPYPCYSGHWLSQDIGQILTQWGPMASIHLPVSALRFLNYGNHQHTFPSPPHTHCSEIHGINLLASCAPSWSDFPWGILLCPTFQVLDYSNCNIWLPKHSWYEKTASPSHLPTLLATPKGCPNLRRNSPGNFVLAELWWEGRRSNSAAKEIKVLASVSRVEEKAGGGAGSVWGKDFSSAS